MQFLLHERLIFAAFTCSPYPPHTHTHTQEERRGAGPCTDQWSCGMHDRSSMSCQTELCSLSFDSPHPPTTHSPSTHEATCLRNRPPGAEVLNPITSELLTHKNSLRFPAFLGANVQSVAQRVFASFSRFLLHAASSLSPMLIRDYTARLLCNQTAALRPCYTGLTVCRFWMCLCFITFLSRMKTPPEYSPCWFLLSRHSPLSSPGYPAVLPSNSISSAAVFTCLFKVGKKKPHPSGSTHSRLLTSGCTIYSSHCQCVKWPSVDIPVTHLSCLVVEFSLDNCKRSRGTFLTKYGCRAELNRTV